ncbi:PucR family transcriptional regulator [Nocardia aurea]|uniref:PucR family transcriptional regulator n=1 Tax=Nocardia aurea TaxID=2144174 RepID=UPI0033BC7A12
MDERNRSGMYGRRRVPRVAVSAAGAAVAPTERSRHTGAARALGPAAISLRDTESLAEEMVRHFRQTVAQCLTLPDDALRGDITAVTVNCLRIATTILDGRGTPTEHEVAQLESAAARWARDGVPVDVILHALHEGSRMAHELVATRSGIASVAQCVDIGARTVELLDLMTTTVTMAYLREYRAAAGQSPDSIRALTVAMMNGRATAAMARECGVTIADRYHILALSLTYPATAFVGSVDRRAASRQVVRRIRSALAAEGGGDTISSLSLGGGTILIPSTAVPVDRLKSLVDAVADAAEAVVTAVHLEVPVEAIAEHSQTLHHMVDLADRLRRALSAKAETTLYRFDQLAAEYQLTRPGAVRDSLARRLDPLMAHPVLLETLTVYLLNDQNRQHAARRMYIHPNTIDHRLKRIAVITGLDPARADGQWALRAALIARTFPPRGESSAVDEEIR